MKTYEEPLVLRNFTYTETGYSLNVQTKADASDERFKKSGRSVKGHYAAVCMKLMKTAVL